MAKMRKEEAVLDMTPMIDVVFQLIIFFVVTLKLDEQSNPEIRLPDSRYGEVIRDKGSAPQGMYTIEVDKKGRFSVHGIYLEPAVLENMLRVRYKRYGEFPILIRGDLRAVHQQVRAAMDMCTGVGIAKVNIAGVYERKKSDRGKGAD